MRGPAAEGAVHRAIGLSGARQRHRQPTRDHQIRLGHHEQARGQIDRVTTERVRRIAPAPTEIEAPERLGDLPPHERFYGLL